jgi:hypothetical protein
MFQEQPTVRLFGIENRVVFSFKRLFPNCKFPASCPSWLGYFGTYRNPVLRTKGPG